MVASKSQTCCPMRTALLSRGGWAREGQVMYGWRAVITTYVYAPRVVDVLVKLPYGGKGAEEYTRKPCNYEWVVGLHPEKGLTSVSISKRTVENGWWRQSLNKPSGRTD